MAAVGRGMIANIAGATAWGPPCAQFLPQAVQLRADRANRPS